MTAHTPMAVTKMFFKVTRNYPNCLPCGRPTLTGYPSTWRPPANGIRIMPPQSTTDLPLAGDEYIDPADGLIHTVRNAAATARPSFPVLENPAISCSAVSALVRPRQSASAKRPGNKETAWRVSSTGGRRGFKTAICMIIPLPTITGKTR